MVKDAKNAKELFALFEEGSINRHTASTSKIYPLLFISSQKVMGNF